jgi:Protein of unknown function (DUF1523).
MTKEAMKNEVVRERTHRMLEAKLFRETPLMGKLWKSMKYIGWAGLVVVGVAWVLFLNYTLPSTMLVRLTNSYVLRVGQETEVRNIRMINAQTLDGKPFVFRNEDTGFGWPPYFKFNSGNVTSEVEAIVKHNPNAPLLVTYYGWRLEILSMFPNIIKLEVVPADYKHFPWFNVIFITVFHGILLFFIFRIYRKFKHRGDNKHPE